MISATFGSYIKDKRIETGKSLRQLGQELELSASYLSEVERGIRPQLKRTRWEALVKAIPSITIEELELRCASSRVLRRELAMIPDQYRHIAIALVRRTRTLGLSKERQDAILNMLTESDR